MTDIVERLRSSAKRAGHSKEWDPYAWLEAVDTIERLRAALKPFADFDSECMPDNMRAFDDDPTLVMRHFRNARRALEGKA